VSVVSATWALIASNDGGDSGLWVLGWADFFGGVLAGLIASGIGATAVWCWRGWQRSAAFDPLVGIYGVTRKYPSNEHEGVVRVTRDGATLRFVWAFPDGTQALGTFAMNEQSRMSGSGSYKHFRGAAGWGFLIVHVASRERDATELLVDGRYTQDRDEVSTAWVWEKRSPLHLGHRPLIDVPLPGR
jgi:hypothetical protein